MSFPHLSDLFGPQESAYFFQDVRTVISILSVSRSRFPILVFCGMSSVPPIRSRLKLPMNLMDNLVKYWRRTSHVCLPF